MFCLLSPVVVYKIVNLNVDKLQRERDRVHGRDVREINELRLGSG